VFGTNVRGEDGLWEHGFPPIIFPSGEGTSHQEHAAGPRREKKEGIVKRGEGKSGSQKYEIFIQIETSTRGGRKGD